MKSYLKRAPERSPLIIISRTANCRPTTTGLKIISENCSAVGRKGLIHAATIFCHRDERNWTPPLMIPSIDSTDPCAPLYLSKSRRDTADTPALVDPDNN